MPIGPSLDDTLIELVGAWIDAGAITDCASAEPNAGPGDEPNAVPTSEPIAAPVSQPGASPNQPASEPAGPPTLCDVGDLFATLCFMCHGANATVPDLTLEGMQAGTVVGAASQYEGETLVIVDSPDDSFLYQKIAGTQEVGQGGPMPIGGALSDDERALVHDWIEAGASTSCDGAPNQARRPEASRQASRRQHPRMNRRRSPAQTQVRSLRPSRPSRPRRVPSSFRDRTDSCEVDVAIFQPHCAVCHGAGGTAPS